MEGGSGDNVEREVVWQVYSPIKAGHFLPRHTELTSTRPIFLIEPQNRNTKKSTHNFFNKVPFSDFLTETIIFILLHGKDDGYGRNHLLPTEKIRKGASELVREKERERERKPAGASSRIEERWNRFARSRKGD